MRKLDRRRRKRWYGYDEKLVHELFVKKSTLKANDIPGTLPHVMLLQHNNRDFDRTILWHLRNMDVCACKGLSTMITRCSEPQVRLDHLYLSKNGSASAWLPVISFVCDRVAWRWFSFAIRRIYYIEYMFFYRTRLWLNGQFSYKGHLDVVKLDRVDVWLEQQDSSEEFGLIQIFALKKQNLMYW